jgi:hypothetical protein
MISAQYIARLGMVAKERLVWVFYQCALIVEEVDVRVRKLEEADA